MPDLKCSKTMSVFLNRRASAPAYEKGSITVEAALAVPVFFLAVVSLLYLMELMAVRTSVRAGLQAAGKRAMQDACIVSVFTPLQIERDVVEAVGEKRLENSMIVGGSEGIQCEGSYLSAVTGIGKLQAAYEVKLPIPLFSVPPLSFVETVRIKAWTGYEREAFGREEDETVYVTETGIVYHKDYYCTYLKLSIHIVQASETGSLRNVYGGKYDSCEKCFQGTSAAVYITDSGDRYHSSLSCSGLKRTVYAVPLSEAAGKGMCSRCGG